MIGWALERVLARARGALVPPASAARIRELSREIPDVAIAGGFETRLGDDSSPHADYAIWLTARGGSAAKLAALDESRDAVLRHPEWRALRDFGREWSRADSEIARFVPFLILEFDTDRASAERPIPSVFVCIEPWPLWSQKSARVPALPSWVTERALPLLRGAPLPSAVRERLEATFAALPQGGAFMHAAAMLSRGVDAVRVFAAVPALRLTDFLRDAGWPGDVEAFDRLRLGYVGDEQLAAIQLDVGESVGPRASLELSVDARESKRAVASSRRFLDRLVKDGLCSDEKRAALLDWRQSFAAETDDGSWPLAIDQRISHFKIAMTPGRPLEAKAYFFFEPSRRVFL
jgi:hypothetical protein